MEKRRLTWFFNYENPRYFRILVFLRVVQIIQVLYSFLD